MDEFIRGFWNFAGDYWWLIFPIMGMAGGAAKAWERSSSVGTSAGWRRCV